MAPDWSTSTLSNHPRRFNRLREFSLRHSDTPLISRQFFHMTCAKVNECEEVFCALARTNSQFPNRLVKCSAQQCSGNWCRYRKIQRHANSWAPTPFFLDPGAWHPAALHFLEECSLPISNIWMNKYRSVSPSILRAGSGVLLPAHSPRPGYLQRREQSSRVLSCLQFEQD